MNNHRFAETSAACCMREALSHRFGTACPKIVETILRIAHSTMNKFAPAILGHSMVNALLAVSPPACAARVNVRTRSEKVCLLM